MRRADDSGRGRKSQTRCPLVCPTRPPAAVRPRTCPDSVSRAPALAPVRANAPGRPCKVHAIGGDTDREPWGGPRAGIRSFIEFEPPGDLLNERQVFLPYRAAHAEGEDGVPAHGEVLPRTAGPGPLAVAGNELQRRSRQSGEPGLGPREVGEPVRREPLPC